MIGAVREQGRAIWNRIDDQENGRVIGLALFIIGGAIFKELCVLDKMPFSKSCPTMQTAKTISLAITILGSALWLRPRFFSRET